jgi:hypothetical protein
VEPDPVFKGVDVGNYNYNNINLLVGRNVKLLFLPLHGKENVRVDKNGVLAVNTKLGWTIAGPLKTAATTARYSCNVKIVNASTIVSSKDEEVSIAVKLRHLNNVNALGIEPKKTEMSRKEVRKQAALNKSTFWKDGCITLQMLWCGKASSGTFFPAKQQRENAYSCCKRSWRRQHLHYERSTPRQSLTTWTRAM